MRLRFSLSLADVPPKANGARRRSPVLEGYTRDVSATGLALILPAIRLGEHYLTGEGRTLHVVLEFPSGTIEMNVIPVRYERLDESETEKGYLIGASITEMSDHDRARLKAGMRDE